MPGLLADVNIEGQFVVLLGVLESKEWHDLWRELNVTVYNLDDLGLPTDASDLELWQRCQERDLVLLTANRNLEGDDSLEATIRRLNRSESLPVLTLSNPLRIIQDKRYAHLVAERLCEYLIEIDRYRGTGRIFLP